MYHKIQHILKGKNYSVNLSKSLKKQLIKTDPEVIENMSISISIKFKPGHKENSLSWLHWCGEFYQTFTEETLPVTYQSSRKSHKNVPVLA